MRTVVFGEQDEVELRVSGDLDSSQEDGGRCIKVVFSCSESRRGRRSFFSAGLVKSKNEEN